MKVINLILTLFIFFFISENNYHAQEEYYENSYRSQILDEFDNYPFIFDKSQINRLKDYQNLCPNDREIQFMLINLYELYGNQDESIRLLKKVQNELINQSKTHEYFYFKNIGYQRYFYHKFNMSNELKNADKIYFNLKKPEIKTYFQKESWIPIDLKLKLKECPNNSEFAQFNERLEIYKRGTYEGIALMVFIRMHFDMLFYGGCLDNAKDIRESFKSLNEIRKNKYTEALYSTMLADFKLLEEGKACSKSEAYKLYDKVDGYIGTEINAEWIRQEIEYRMERINGQLGLERPSGACEIGN